MKKHLVAVGVLLFAIACAKDEDGDTTPTPADNGPYSVTLSGTGYSFHNGSTMHAAIVRTSDSVIVAGPDTVVVSGGTFSFTWSDVLDKGVAYTAQYYVDINANDSCDTPPTDHAVGSPGTELEFAL